MGGALSGLLGTNSSVQTGQSAPIQLQNVDPALQQALANYSQNQQQQQGLAQQLQQVASGGAQSPVQQQINAIQGQNAAQAAGVYANNRALNPALAARNASQLQANAGQQAAQIGAGAQLGAMSGLGNLYGQVGNQALGLYGTGQSAQAAQNNAINNMNAVNAGIAGGNQGAAKGIVGGLLGAGGSAAGLAAAHGGMVPKMAEGGPVNTFDPNMGGPQSSIGQYLAAAGSPDEALSKGIQGFGSGIGKYIKGKPFQQIDVGSNPTGIVADNPVGMTAAYGGKIPGNYKQGGGVPGKAKISGDSLKNDTVPAVLSPGEVVIPRSVMKSKNPGEQARKFVEAILAKQSMRKA